MPMSLPEDLRQRCLANYAAVQESVAEACRKAGREVNDVRIVGVTNYVSAEWAAELVRAGCRDLAESRPQLLWDKAEALAGGPPATQQGAPHGGNGEPDSFSRQSAVA